VIGLWTAADRTPAPVSGVYLLVCAAVFLSGWILSRGANLQKYTFKVDPEKPFVAGISQERISDGKRHVLCGGFWGLSRHINYLGEVLMATGLTLALGYPGALIPWLYPLYYVVLLSTRQADDDRRCREKYGRLWDEYKKRVPWRIIPGLY
jgi:delta14-sterol reductase